MEPAPESELERIEQAAERLRRGLCVAFPTETVYGLGADAQNAAAVQRVYDLKGRPARNPLIVHITGPEMAAPLVSRWTAGAERLARAFWPGPLTLVLPRSERVPSVVAAGGQTVALRAPDHPLATALLLSFGGPLVGPSANRSGLVSPTRAEHVRAAFPEDEVMVLDGGPCGMGIESTVIWLAEGPARVLRPGVIGTEALANVLGEHVHEAAQTTLSEEEPLASPGMLSSHYAPRTPAYLVNQVELFELLAEHRSVAILSHHVALEVPEPHRLLRMPGLAPDFAAALYATLREADALGAEVIAVTTPPTRGDTAAETAIWRAVHDRLARATRAW